MSIRLVLSPHLDDAALSCGGVILAQTSAGERVRVLNIFAGIPDYTHLSAYARRQHAKWGEPADPYAERRAEDARALQAAGIEVNNWDDLDAIYRPPGGPFLYTNHDEVFGPIHAAEGDYSADIAARLARYATPWPAVVWHAPLAVGGHVDHRLVRDAALALYHSGHHVNFYEDFPYAATWQEVTEVLDDTPYHWQADLIPIDVTAKVDLIRGYESQLLAVFGPDADIEEVVRGYARAVAPHGTGTYERVWRIQRAPLV